MSDDKFIQQNETFAKFIQIYCDDNHAHEAKVDEKLHLVYNGVDLQCAVDYRLCASCQFLLLHANERLLSCPHDPKPRCRHCKAPCYDREIYKKIAKIMRSSGIKLGLSRVKKLFKMG